MKEEITKLVNRVIISQELNKRTNEMIKNNHTEYFSTVQLKMIAELSAELSVKANREAREKLKGWETELAECKRIFDERRQPLYEDKQTEDEEHCEGLGTKCWGCAAHGECDEEEKYEQK